MKTKVKITAVVTKVGMLVSFCSSITESKASARGIPNERRTNRAKLVTR